MKINEKCMRDILQHCVNNIHVTRTGITYTSLHLFDFPKIFSPLYTDLEVCYSLVKLIELNYIIIENNSDDRWDEKTSVIDVTYQGHKYLESFPIEESRFKDIFSR